MTTANADEWTQDSVWYAVEDDLRKGGIIIGKRTRNWVKRLIRILCADAGVTRESLGIIATPKMHDVFNNNWESVSFDKIEELAGRGTDIVFIEKLDIVKVTW